jgi:hypothetical protein
MNRVVLEQEFGGWVDSVKAVAEPPQSKKAKTGPPRKASPTERRRNQGPRQEWLGHFFRKQRPLQKAVATKAGLRRRTG